MHLGVQKVFETNPAALGGGGGKVGKGSLLTGLLPTSALITAVAGGITLGVGNVLSKSGDASLLNAGSGGSGGIGSGDFFAGLAEDNRKGIEKVEEFNRKLSETQATFAETKGKANDYFLFLKNGHPSELSTRFTVTGVDTAKAEIRSYLDMLALVADAHGHPPRRR